MSKLVRTTATNETNKRDARRNEIVAACRKLYETKSFYEITICDVSRLVKFSRPTIYNYFHTKEEIFLALFQQEFELWSEELRCAVDAAKSVSVPQPRRLAEIVAVTLSRRKTLFKLLSMNVFDMERGSRRERIIDFKRVFKNAYDALDSALIKFFPQTKPEVRSEFHSIFWPFLSGVYLFANLTESQRESMATVGLPPFNKNEGALVFEAVSALFAKLSCAPALGRR